MRLLLPLLLLTLCFTGCDSTDDGGGDLALGSMAAEIDGEGWSAANATITEVSAAGNRTLTINGARVGAEISTLNVSVTAVGGATLGTGPYAIGDDGTDNVFGTGAYAPSPTSQATYLATSGTLTIDALDDDGARGTFSFTAERPNTGETVTVAGGRFNVAFGPDLPTFP